MFDEMAIREHVTLDGKQFRGFVDLGDGDISEGKKNATEALVFMEVFFQNSYWVFFYR